MEDLEDSRDIRDSFTKHCTNKEQWQVAVKGLTETHNCAQDEIERGNRTLELIEEVKKELKTEEEETDVEEIVREEDPVKERVKNRRRRDRCGRDSKRGRSSERK